MRSFIVISLCITLAAQSFAATNTLKTVKQSRLTATGQKPSAAPAAPAPVIQQKAENGEWSKEKKTVVLNTAVIGGFMLYGLKYWDYGENPFQFVNEGWFEKHSIHGGADKLGHAFSTYVTSMSFAALYEYWGYDRHQASFNGALSGWASFFMIEVADGTSKHGFSVEDLVVDTIGAFTAYLRREYPEFERRVDFRAQYKPSYGAKEVHKLDIAGDYSGYKYLMAFKGDGFDCTADTWLKYLELHVGYYSLGYQDEDTDAEKDANGEVMVDADGNKINHYGSPHRNIYVGIGVNLAHLLNKGGYHKTATIFNYYQVPYTYLPADYNIDK